MIHSFGSKSSKRNIDGDRTDVFLPLDDDAGKPADTAASCNVPEAMSSCRIMETSLAIFLFLNLFSILAESASSDAEPTASGVRTQYLEETSAGGNPSACSSEDSPSESVERHQNRPNGGPPLFPLICKRLVSKFK